MRNILGHIARVRDDKWVHLMCQVTRLVLAAGNVYLVPVRGHVWLLREEHRGQLMMSILGGRGVCISMRAMCLPCVDFIPDH